MNPYVIITDSACDIVPEMLAEWGVRCQSLSVRFDHIDKDFLDGEMPVTEFYQTMRDGHVAKTSAVNAEAFRTLFTEELDKGYDVLYIGFSSGLSTTSVQAEVAASELREQYPDRKIITVDTLAASAGFGLIVYLAVEKKNTGATIEEVEAYVREALPNLCHWFTVDDLVYLKRGGRVSPAVALVGGMLSIKPVMHVDDEGHLTKVGTVRGRKKSLEELANRFAELALDPANGVIFISHGDCMDDVNLLCDMLKARGGNDVKVITHVGTVIGAHSGPGTMALFFLGKNR